MNAISKIYNKGQDLNSAFSQIEKNRDFWKNNLKSLLLSRLDYAVNNALSGMTVQQNNIWENLENVSLNMPDRHSGITEKALTYTKGFSMVGGYLLFSQTTNGRIVIVIVYPSIEDFTSQKPHKQVKFYAPEEVTETVIDEAIMLFLDEMTDWVRNEDTPMEPIGFITKTVS